VAKETHCCVLILFTYGRWLSITQIWSPSTLRDIDAIESVQRKFTKRLPDLYSVSYTDRLKRLHLQSLELRRLDTDLIWCYKIVFGHVDVDIGDSLNIRPVSCTRGHDYKLYTASQKKGTPTLLIVTFKRINGL